MKNMTENNIESTESVIKKADNDTKTTENVINSNDVENVDKDKAIKKLKDMLSKFNDKSMAEPVVAYLVKRAEEDTGVAADVLLDGKNLEGCMAYVYNKAREYAKGKKQIAVRDELVYEWAEDYFHAEESKSVKTTKKEKQSIEKEKQAIEKPTVKTDKSTEKEDESIEKKSKPKADKPEKPQKKATKPKKEEKESSGIGQMSIFDLMM